MINQVRGVATISLSGVLSIELMSRYKEAIRLRETLTTGTGTSKVTTDSGFYSFRPFDVAASPAGNGFLVHMFDRPGGTLMATGVATQRGQRAAIELTLSGSAPTNGSQLEIQYPDMRDEAADFAMITKFYTFATTEPLTLADTVLVGSNEETLDNLVTAINGSQDYAAAEVGPGTTGCIELTARRTSLTTISIEARQGGTWGGRIFTREAAASSATNLVPSSITRATGGTGNHGLDITFEASALPNTLLTAPDTSAWVHVEIFGVDDEDRPIKIAQCPANIYGSSTVAPS